ncbi:hypothetical protein CEXT_671331, partial [Caerostris extrusa]
IHVACCIFLLTRADAPWNTNLVNKFQEAAKIVVWGNAKISRVLSHHGKVSIDNDKIEPMICSHFPP